MKWPLASVVSVLSVTGSCMAQADLFLAEYQYQAARMISLGSDGSNPTVLFDIPAKQWLPLGITFDAAAGRMIWMDSGGASEVWSANLDGSDLAIITPVDGFGRGAALDAQGRVYSSANNFVQRVNPDGTDLTYIYMSKYADPVGTCEVDATNGPVYVGAEGKILRMDLDGSNLKVIVSGISQPRAIGLDIGAGYIYWLDADLGSDYVGRARLDGTDFTVLIDNTPNVVSGSNSLIDLLVDPAGGKLYFADEIPATLYRANLDGTELELIYTSPPNKAPSGITLSTGEPVQPMRDCDNNGINDDIDIANGAPDCDNNGVPDSCQVNPCPNRVFLLDQDSDAASFNGRALGVPSEWQIFQPFEVPEEGWTIGEIGLDGYTANYADGSGLTARIFPDDGSGERPDETKELASAVLNLRFNTNFQNWVYAPVDATLEGGLYWVRLEANNPTVYSGSINHGFIGLLSKSRGSSGNFTQAAPPIALRLVQGGSECAADFNQDDTVNSQDFFDFLTAFFALTPNADFNADGTVNSQDFFDFLTAFFAGC